MKKIAAFFASPIVISLIGLIALSVLIWFGGPYIKFGEDNSAPLGGTTARLVAIMVLLVLWGLNNLRMQMQRNKSNQNLVDGLDDSQKQAAADMPSGQAAEEVAQINERFAQALNTLKNFKFKGRTGDKALYELPWYIIVGPPGSGKTTALVNSGLNFPLAEKFGKNALQGVGGTRNCDWWFTNEAVLIDTAGRYTTQDSHKVVDSSAWEGFLGLLKKNRRRRPINGAIVSISLQDLLMQTEDERVMHARTIRTRLDELMEKLEIRFPVYLMFTKSDLVSGFSEFFEDIPKDDRDQVWGMSLPNTPGIDQSPDFDFVHTEFEALEARLYDRVLWRMHHERDPKRRAQIQGFPQQFENISRIAEGFVRQAFSPNRFKFQPYLRGVYFTSGTQDGTPIDRLMASVASNFGFTREVAQSANQQGKSFFLANLFNEVIFPESELVGSNVRYEKLMRWARRGAYLGMAGVMGVAGVGWSSSVVRHNMYMGEVVENLETYKAESQDLPEWNKDIRLVLPPLNALARASIVYDQEEHPWLRGMGLYDARVDSRANEAYESQLKELFLPRIIATLEKALQQGYEAGDLYNTFRIYLMFNKLDLLDREHVKSWFEDYWDANLRGEASRRQELSAHLETLLSLELVPRELNDRLVQKTRGALLRVPVGKRVYERIRSNPLYLTEVDMMNEVGDAIRTMFAFDSATRRKLSVPLMFTKEGYDNIDISEDSPVVADVVNERWMLSDDESNKVDFIKEDLDDVSKQVKAIYLAEYTKVWDSLYKSLKVVEFRNLQHADEVLSSIVDPVYSPFIGILEVGASNTQLADQTLDKLAGAKKPAKLKALDKVGSAANKFGGNPVDKFFKEINALSKESKRGPAPVEGVVAKIQQLTDFMADVSLSPDPAKRAFEIAKARYESGTGNAITALRGQAKNLPTPVRTWLERLADQSWKVILQATRQHVAVEWRAQVYDPYSQNLKGRYPLRSSSSDELAMHDFSTFFKPGGTVDTFYDAYLKPFINTRADGANRTVDGYNLGLSSTLLSQLKVAKSIKQIFYRENPEIMTVTLEMRPRSLGEKDARFSLSVGDTRLSYNHGPKFWKTVKWSADSENSRVRVIFEDLSGHQHDRTYNGPWAWFRTLDQANVQKSGRSNVYLVTFSVTDEKDRNLSHNITYEIRAKSINNPLRRDLLSAFRCPDSI